VEGGDHPASTDWSARPLQPPTPEQHPLTGTAISTAGWKGTPLEEGLQGARQELPIMAPSPRAPEKAPAASHHRAPLPIRILKPRHSATRMARHGVCGVVGKAARLFFKMGRPAVAPGGPPHPSLGVGSRRFHEQEDEEIFADAADQALPGRV
jgi:hypothetical protein